MKELNLVPVTATFFPKGCRKRLGDMINEDTWLYPGDSKWYDCMEFFSNHDVRFIKPCTHLAFESFGNSSGDWLVAQHGLWHEIDAIGEADVFHDWLRELESFASKRLPAEGISEPYSVSFVTAWEYATWEEDSSWSQELRSSWDLVGVVDLSRLHDGMLAVNELEA